MRFRCAGSDCDWGDEASAVAVLVAITTSARRQLRKSTTTTETPSAFKPKIGLPPLRPIPVSIPTLLMGYPTTKHATIFTSIGFE